MTKPKPKVSEHYLAMLNEIIQLIKDGKVIEGTITSSQETVAHWDGAEPVDRERIIIGLVVDRTK